MILCPNTNKSKHTNSLILLGNKIPLLGFCEHMWITHIFTIALPNAYTNWLIGTYGHYHMYKYLSNLRNQENKQLLAAAMSVSRGGLLEDSMSV